MICTFNKSLDESAFLVSIPMVGGKALEPDENQKLLFEYGDGEEAGIIAGYVDDTVKVGIRRFLEGTSCNRTQTVYQACGCTYEGGSAGEIHAGYLGTEFRRRDRSGAGRDYGYFQRRSCNLYEPLV